jgi:hypothetical protein
MKYLILILLIILFSCSKRQHPQAASNGNSLSAKKNSVTTVPKILTVEDKIAIKSVDGRLYFDFEGHRYWKNYNNGRYYLFNKSMYNNPAFKPH